jgi:hypothetical protein
LTIICKEGAHPIPKDQLPGQAFSATAGNVPGETATALGQSIADACKRVAQLIIREGPFSEIYLVLSGYSVLLQKLAETIFQISDQPATALHFDRRTKTYWPNSHIPARAHCQRLSVTPSFLTRASHVRLVSF